MDSIISAEDAKQALDAAHLKLKIELLWHLARIDMENPKSLTFAVHQLGSVGFQQEDLAKCTKTSRATISRWGKGQKIPPSPIYRHKLIETLREHLTRYIEHELSSRPDLNKILAPVLAAKVL